MTPTGNSPAMSFKARDYDAENRGKTRCQLVAASMPFLLELGEVDMPTYKKLVDELVEYIFTGK